MESGMFLMNLRLYYIPTAARKPELLRFFMAYRAKPAEVGAGDRNAGFVVAFKGCG